MKTLVCTMLLLALCTVTFAAEKSSASYPRFIEVTGTGQVKSEPDVAILGVSIEVIDVDLQKAKASVDQTIGRLIALAREMKLAEEDVTATQLIIHPEYNWNEGKREFIGNLVNRQVTFRIRDLQLVNRMIDGAVKAGANKVDKLELESSRSTELTSEAQSKAIADARSKALKIASDLDVTLGKVQQVITQRDSLGEFIEMGGAADTFKPGLITVNSEVQIKYEIKD